MLRRLLPNPSLPVCVCQRLNSSPEDHSPRSGDLLLQEQLSPGSSGCGRKCLLSLDIPSVLYLFSWFLLICTYHSIAIESSFISLLLPIYSDASSVSFRDLDQQDDQEKLSNSWIHMVGSKLAGRAARIPRKSLFSNAPVDVAKENGGRGSSAQSQEPWMGELLSGYQNRDRSKECFQFILRVEGPHNISPEFLLSVNALYLLLFPFRTGMFIVIILSPFHHCILNMLGKITCLPN